MQTFYTQWFHTFQLSNPSYLLYIVEMRKLREIVRKVVQMRDEMRAISRSSRLDVVCRLDF